MNGEGKGDVGHAASRERLSTAARRDEYSSGLASWQIMLTSLFTPPIHIFSFLAQGYGIYWRWESVSSPPSFFELPSLGSSKSIKSGLILRMILIH